MATKFGEIRLNHIIISFIIIAFVVFSLLINSGLIFAANPSPPDFLNVSSNTTRVTPSQKLINISGGYIATVNITATIQNSRWKAFVGLVTGKFTLQDSTGSQVYDWNIASYSGRVYATRNVSSPTWSNINCSNVTTLNAENVLLQHTNINDNLTATFNISTNATHPPFYVAGRFMTNHSCPTLNTYVNNGSQDNIFDEVALYDNVNIVYAALLENRLVGYNGQNFDFQMLVPENGNSASTAWTAYYMYVELD